MQLDTIIKNGTIVTATDSYRADIGIYGEKIVLLGTNLSASQAQIIDAHGNYILPGGVDVHTHLDMETSTMVTKDDFATGTVAAACGGTTTIIDFCMQAQGETLNAALQREHAKAKDKAVIDYSFHIGITDLRAEIVAEMETLLHSGYPTYKLFTAYDFRLNDEEILQVLACVREHGGMVTMHAENFYMINYLVNKFKSTGKTTVPYHALSRPPLAEGEATSRVIKLAMVAAAPLYIVHLTCEEALGAVRAARDLGVQVMAETCPQYLVLSDACYTESDFNGAKYVMSPPLRSAANHNHLWRGLASGAIATVATDHCPFDFKGQKEQGRECFTKIPNGVPGIELRVPLLFTYGVGQGRIGLQKLVAISATNPAKIFGLYPAKGTIAVGSDADLVIFDPKRKVTITKAMLHENVDYTPYEGLPLTGYPRLTVSRGAIIVKEGEYLGAPGRGKFLPRKNIEIL